MRRVKFLAFVFAAAPAAFGAPVFAAGVAVPLDQVRMVSFDRPVSTVYVGNPTVADVTVIDSKRVFVLGKAFGATNIIALDAAGKQVADETLTVYGNSANTVTLNRGTEQITYACAAGRCEAAPVPGDATAAFSAVTGEINQHQSMNKSAALVSASAGQ